MSDHFHISNFVSQAEKIRWLQSLPRRNMRKRNYFLSQKEKERRRVVAMVGDGINDAPVCLLISIFDSFGLILLSHWQALTAADVGIAMGSGTDIALSSAEFVLLSSNLHTLLILTDLSKKVLRRVKFNFVSFLPSVHLKFTN